MCGPAYEETIREPRGYVLHGWEMMPDEMVKTVDGEIMPAYEAERRQREKERKN